MSEYLSTYNPVANPSHVVINPDIWIRDGDNQCNIVYNSGVRETIIDTSVENLLDFENNKLIWQQPGYISLPSDIIHDYAMNSQALTISYWKKTVTTPTTTDTDILITNPNEKVYLKFHATPYNNTQTTVILGDGSGSIQTVSATPNINFSNTFNHFRLILTPLEFKLYINNTLTISETLSFNLAPVHNDAMFHIGSVVAEFKDVRIWAKEVEYDEAVPLSTYSFDSIGTVSSNGSIVGDFTVHNAYLFKDPIYAISFDTPSTYVNIPVQIRSNLNVQNGISFSYWLNYGSTTYNKDNDTNVLWTDNYFVIKNYSCSIYGTTADIKHFEYKPNTWYNIIWTVSYTLNIFTLSCYINGDPVIIKKSDMNIPPSEPSVTFIRFGEHNINAQELMFFNSELSKDTVYNYYNANFTYFTNTYHTEFDGKISNYVNDLATPISLIYPGNQNNIALWWRFDDAVMQNYGSSGNITGTMQDSMTSVDSQLLGAKAGSSGHVTGIDTNGTLMTDTYGMFAISFWHKGSTFSFEGLGLQINAINGEIKYAVSLNTDTGFNSLELSIPGTGILDDNNWHHFVFSFNDSIHLNLFVDNVHRKTVSNNTVSRISSTQTNITLTPTLIQDFRIYTNELSRLDIASSMQNISGLDVEEDHLLLMYQYNTVIDFKIKNLTEIKNTEHYDLLLSGDTGITYSGYSGINSFHFNNGNKLSIQNSAHIQSLLNEMTSGFTIAFWAKNAIYFEISGTGLLIKISNTTGFTVGNVNIPITLPDNNWHHWTFTYSFSNGSLMGTYLNVFMDGDKIAEKFDEDNMVFLNNNFDNLVMFQGDIGATNGYIEDFRLYSINLTPYNVQRIFYEFPEFKNHLDELFIWYRFHSTKNAMGNGYDIVVTGDGITTSVKDGNHYVYSWASNATGYLTFEDNTHVPINISATIVDQEYVFSVPLSFTRGRKYVISWPDGNPIRISSTGVWGEEIDIFWVEYDDVAFTTTITMQYIYYDTPYLYYYNANVSSMGIHEVTLNEPETSVYSALQTMVSNNFSMSYWCKTASHFLITLDGTNPIMDLSTSNTSVKFQIGLGDGTVQGKSETLVATDNDWHHWVFMFDDTTPTTENTSILKIFKDGVIVSQETILEFPGFSSIVFSDVLNLKIGSPNSSLRDFRVYLKHLNDNEMYMLRNYHSFDQGLGMNRIEGLHNPYALHFTTAGKETHIIIPPDFLELSRKNTQLTIMSWIYPKSNTTMEIDFNIDDTKLKFKLQNRNVIFTFDDKTLADDSIALFENTWYRVLVTATDFNNYVDMSLSILNIQNVEQTNRINVKYYGTLNLSDSVNAKFVNIRDVILDKFSITGAKDNLLVDYKFVSLENNKIVNNAINNAYDATINETVDLNTIQSTTSYTNGNSLYADQSGLSADITMGSARDLFMSFSTIELTVMFWKNDLDMFKYGADFLCYNNDGDIIKIVAPDQFGSVSCAIANQYQTIEAKTDNNKILSSTWYFYSFIVRYDGLGTNVDIYVNAVLAGSTRVEGFVPFKGLTATGTRLGGATSAPSYIEDFRIYNSALSSEEIYKVYYVNNKVADTDANVYLRFQDLVNFKNLGKYRDTVTPLIEPELNVVYDNNNDITVDYGVIQTVPGTFYSGSNYHQYRMNNRALFFERPTGNEYIWMDATKILEDFNSQNRMSIMFKQKINVLRHGTVMNSFSIKDYEDNERVLIDIKIPDEQNQIKVQIGTHVYTQSLTGRAIDSLWIGWIFTFVVRNQYIYMKIYRDGQLLAGGKKTFDNTVPFEFSTSGNPIMRIGPFNDNVYIEDFRIYNKLLSYSDMPKVTNPIKIAHDTSVYLTKDDFSQDLENVFSGVNVTYSVHIDPLNSARIDGTIAKIMSNYRGQTYDVVFKASNNEGHTFWTVTVEEVNAPPIETTFPEADATLVINGDISEMGTEGTDQYNTFINDVKTDLVTSSELDSDLVVLGNITEGSILIDFIIKPDPKNPDIIPADIIVKMAENGHPKNNKFKNGKITRRATIRIPNRISRQALEPDTFFLTLDNDKPKTFLLTDYFTGLSVNYQTKVNPYNNVVIDKKESTMTITGNFRSDDYVIELRAINPSSIRTLKFNITEIEPTPPTSKNPILMILGDESETVDIIKYFIGVRLLTFEIVENPYNNVTLIESTEGTQIYSVQGNFRNEEYQIKFKATQSGGSVNQEAIWTLNVYELPPIPTKLVPDIPSLALERGQDAVYDLTTVFSGESMVYEFGENLFGATIEGTVFTIHEKSRGVTYPIQIIGKNDSKTLTWNLTITEGMPPPPSTIATNDVVTLDIDSYDIHLSNVFEGINLEYDIAQYYRDINSPPSYILPEEHAILTANPPWSRYHAQNWNSTVLEDTSGNYRGNLTLLEGVIRERVKAGNGTSIPINFIEGNKNAKASFPMPGTSEWTLAAIVRYTGLNRNKILHGENTILGHWNGNRGVVQIGSSFVTNPVNVGTVDDWLVVCVKSGTSSSALTPNNVLLNNTPSGITNGQSSPTVMYINGDGESDWAISDIMVWDSILSDSDLSDISQIFNGYLNGTSQILREDKRILNISSLYNNVSINNDTGELNVLGNYRGTTYDVYVTAENIKANTSWTLTVTELPPPPPESIGNQSLTFTTGNYEYDITSIIDGFNITYSITGPDDYYLVTNSNTLILLPNYRNTNYDITISGSNMTDTKDVVLSITETNTQPPVLLHDGIYYINDSSEGIFYNIFDNVDSVANQSEDYLTYDIVLNNLNIDVNLIQKNHNIVTIDSTNEHGTRTNEFHIIKDGYETNLIPTSESLEIPKFDLYVEYGFVEFNLGQIKIANEYKILHNPFEYENNIDIVKNIIHLTDDRRGTYDVIISCDDYHYILRIHERSPVDINKHNLVNLLFDTDIPDTNKKISNYTNNILKIDMLLRYVPPVVNTDVNTNLYFTLDTDNDLHIDMKNIFKGYILSYSIIQDNLFNNATIDNKSGMMTVKYNDRDSDYDIIVRAENDSGFASTTVSINEYKTSTIESSLKVWYLFDGIQYMINMK